MIQSHLWIPSMLQADVERLQLFSLSPLGLASYVIEVGGRLWSAISLSVHLQSPSYNRGVVCLLMSIITWLNCIHRHFRARVASTDWISKLCKCCPWLTDIFMWAITWYAEGNMQGTKKSSRTSSLSWTSMSTTWMQEASRLR